MVAGLMGTMVSPWSGHHLSLSSHSKVSLLLPETFLSPPQKHDQRQDGIGGQCQT